MRPTFSILFFTVMSGAGYGLLFLVGIGLLIGVDAAAGTALIFGFALTSAGLLSSLLHLGQPQRAWRALSQWRSSWLSREGVAALLTLVPLVALGSIFLWPSPIPASHGMICALGALLAVLSAVTVYCTSGIYSSLKTIHAWRNAYVLPGYLLLGLLGGASVLWLLEAITHRDHTGILPGLIGALAIAAAALKLVYWRYIDTTPPGATIESATGLGRFGPVRAAEAPHTEENYLTHEMGFVLARKHAARLRAIALILIGATPAVLAFITVPWPAFAPTCASLAALSVIAGSFVERWLFFAQAKHVVMLYYGATRG
jgi:sulfite dehydrogenase (quinone) subunit SoeC